MHRIVNHFAKRPQVQERMTVQIFNELQNVLDTKDVGLLIDADHLCVASRGIQDITSKLSDFNQMISIYEVTGDYDLIIIAKFTDTGGMNKQIKAVLADPIIKASNTSVVLNAVVENRQFEMEIPAV